MRFFELFRRTTEAVWSSLLFFSSDWFLNEHFSFFASLFVIFVRLLQTVFVGKKLVALARSPVLHDNSQRISASSANVKIGMPFRVIEFDKPPFSSARISVICLMHYIANEKERMAQSSHSNLLDVHIDGVRGSTFYSCGPILLIDAPLDHDFLYVIESMF